VKERRIETLICTAEDREVTLTGGRKNPTVTGKIWDGLLTRSAE